MIFPRYTNRKIWAGATDNTTLALNQDAILYAWGTNAAAQLGENDLASRSSPTSVLLGNRLFFDVASYVSSTTALEWGKGFAWSWGLNTSGQLGDNTATNRSSPVSVVGGRSFIKVATSNLATYAIEGSTGNVYAWGANTLWQLGNNDTTLANKSSPISVIGGGSFSLIAAGGNTVIVGDGTNTYTWGDNTNGALGNQLYWNQFSPVSVVGGRSIKAITDGNGGGLQVAAIEGSTGNIYVWGFNGSGVVDTQRLGDNTTTNRSSPVSVVGGRSYSSVVTGNWAMAAIEASTGNAYCWGYGRIDGNLGDNTFNNRSSPVSVVGGRSWSAITLNATQTTTALEASTGNIYCWGTGTNGTLGNNQVAVVASPVSIFGGRSFSSFSFNYGIEGSTGNAYAWGLGTTGQLGDNTILSKSSPVSVVGGRSWKQLFCAVGQYAIEASTGNAYAWGAGAAGVLGNNLTNNQSSPVSVVGGRSFSTISANWINSTGVIVALEASTGRAYTWGGGSNGILGNNLTNNQSSPVSVVGGRSFSKIMISQMAFSQTGTCMLAIEGSTGNLYTWGSNNNGQLGDGSTNNRSSPVSVLGGRSFVAIGVAGNLVTANLSVCYAIEGSTGNVYAWGAATTGGLGNNTDLSSGSPVSVMGGYGFNQYATGTSHNLAIEASTGRAYSWGLNTTGQLGLNSITSPVSSPSSVVGGRSYVKIAASGAVSAAIEGSTGNAYAWGNNANGQLGDNTLANRSSPVSVLGGISFNHITIGGTHTMGVDGSGIVWAWGTNTAGEFANTNYGNQLSPISVPGGRSASAIFGSTTALVNGAFIEGSTGNLYAWGINSTNGSLGDGTLINRSSPVSVLGGRSYKTIVLTGGNVTQLFFLGIENNTGNGYAAGFNSAFGNLGDGSFVNRNSPVSVAGGRSFSAIASNHLTTALGLEASTGNAYSWGSGTSGILGNNTITSAGAPVSVVGGYSFTAIATAYNGNTAMAIEGSTGTVYCWGANASGQLGNNSTANTSSPVSVQGGRSYSAISGGNLTSYAIEASTGNAYAWGSAGHGQLGNNQTAANALSPVSVVGGRSFKTLISNLNNFNCNVIAIEGSTGLAWCWGISTNGILGDGATSDRSSPVSVLGGRSWSKVTLNIGGGNNQIIAIEGSTGNAYCWGSNNSGQLGDNTLVNRSSPVSVMGGRSFVAVATSANAGVSSTSYAIEGSTGNVYSWGAVVTGALANGYDNFTMSPVSITQIISNFNR